MKIFIISLCLLFVVLLLILTRKDKEMMPIFIVIGIASLLIVILALFLC
jgi:hypothetical protein